MKITNFQPESCDMTRFGKNSCQKVAKLHLYCITFEILVQNKLKLYFWIAPVMCF